MGFSREVQRVGDVSLPLAFRLCALGSAIQFAQPIGFTATFACLQDKLQVPWRAPELRLLAARLLEEQHHLHVEIETLYADLRRTQKGAGFRFPPRTAVTPAVAR